MLHQYLATRSLDELTAEFNIKIKRHPTLPLAVLNYDQVRSPKNHPVVRECRQKIIETHAPHRVVARSFDRFFNLDERPEETAVLLERWNDAVFQEKHDGSLISVFFYAGEFRVATRGSFADGSIAKDGPTWDAVVRSLVDLSVLNSDNTYVFELCTKWNRVIRNYAEDCMFLLTVVNTQSGRELADVEIDRTARGLRLQRPRVFPVANATELRGVIAEEAKRTPGFEGLVARIPLSEGVYLRLKVKDAGYLEAHHLILGPVTWTNLVTVVVRGELDEALLHPRFEARKGDALRVLEAWTELRAEIEATWKRVRHSATRKDLALTLQAEQCPYRAMMFALYKNPTQDEIPSEFFTEHCEWIAERLGALVGP